MVHPLTIELVPVRYDSLYKTLHPLYNVGVLKKRDRCLMKRKPVQITLPIALDERLTAASKESDIPKTRLAERALIAYLNEYFPPAPKHPGLARVDISTSPETYALTTALEKERAGYPLFTKDLESHHVAPAHLFATEDKSAA